MATAEVVPPGDFADQIKAAMDEAGVFSRGTTLITRERTPEQGHDGYVTKLARVNADGSLTFHQTDSDGVLDVRCVRRNVCWQRTGAARADAKWHRLPKKAVDYTPAGVDLWGPFVAAMPPAAVFDVSRKDGGAQVFSVAIPSGATAGTTTWVVSEGTTTIVLTSTNADGVTTETARVVYRARTKPVAVRAPAARVIGRPTLGVEVPVISVSYNGS